MRGQTAKLLRKISHGDRERYRLLKRAWTRSPLEKRVKGTALGKDVIELERQSKELEKLKLNPPVEIGETPG